MLLYYLPRVAERVPRMLEWVWDSIQAPFGRLTPDQAGIRRDYLVTSLRHLLAHERLPIVIGGISLNALGAALAIALPGLLYLDMIGTASTAFLLGPWYGAIVATISSSLTNYALFPQIDAFPWMLVNIVGGLFWGVVASMPRFRLFGDQFGPIIGWRPIIVGGALGAFVLAVPATITFHSVGPEAAQSLAIDARLASAIDQTRLDLSRWLGHNRAELTGGEFGVDHEWIAAYIMNVTRFLPDKIITVAIALMVIRLAAPLFWRLRVWDRPAHSRTFLQPRQPLLFLVANIGVMILHHLFTLSSDGDLSPHTPAYSLLYGLLIAGTIVIWIISEIGRVTSDQEARQACERAEVYRMADTQAAQIARNTDARGVTAVLLLVVAFTGFALIAVSGLGKGENLIREVGGIFRAMSGTVIGMIFVLSLVRTAVRQNSVLAALPELLERARRTVDEQNDSSTSDPDPKEDASKLPKKKAAARKRGNRVTRKHGGRHS